MANFETNQANMNASMKKLENQIRQLAHSMKERSSRSFPSDTEKNPKECMGIDESKIHLFLSPFFKVYLRIKSSI